MNIKITISSEYGTHIVTGQSIGDERMAKALADAVFIELLDMMPAKALDEAGRCNHMDDRCPACTRTGNTWTGGFDPC